MILYMGGLKSEAVPARRKSAGIHLVKMHCTRLFNKLCGSENIYFTLRTKLCVLGPLYKNYCGPIV